MATRKPLVLDVSGNIQQLQPADTLGIVSETGQVTQTADAALIAGAAVYQSAADHVNKARANAAGTALVTGLAVAAIGNGSTGTIQNNGIVTLTTAEWDALCGTTGGLAFNTPYFLSPTTAALLTATAPTTTGQLLVRVIVGISTTEAIIRISEPILL